MSGSLREKILSEVAVAGLNTVIAKTQFKVLEVFTHITRKFVFRSFQIRHCVYPTYKSYKLILATEHS